jgi:hypothetical protein
MSDNVTLIPNILQPAATLKAYAPIVVKFWENQETALEGLKEFADPSTAAFWRVGRVGNRRDRQALSCLSDGLVCPASQGACKRRLKRPNILAMPTRPPI